MDDNKAIPLKISTTLKCTFWAEKEYNDRNNANMFDMLLINCVR